MCPEEEERDAPHARSSPSVESSRLARLALSGIRKGELPCEVPSMLLAGFGQDKCCSLCTERIAASDVEYEVTSGVDGSARTLHLHIPCYHAWVEACHAHAADDHSAGH